jgi:hypothetical protein
MSQKTLEFIVVTVMTVSELGVRDQFIQQKVPLILVMLCRGALRLPVAESCLQFSDIRRVSRVWGRVNSLAPFHLDWRRAHRWVAPGTVAEQSDHWVSGVGGNYVPPGNIGWLHLAMLWMRDFDKIKKRISLQAHWINASYGCFHIRRFWSLTLN